MAFQRKKPDAVGVKAPFPGFIAPALATSIQKVPSGDRWIHEIKFDGYRVQLHISNSDVKVFTHNGNHWTKRFKKVADDASTSAPSPRSPTVKSSYLPRTALPIFQFCKTN